MLRLQIAIGNVTQLPEYPTIHVSKLAWPFSSQREPDRIAAVPRRGAHFETHSTTQRRSHVPRRASTAQTKARATRVGSDPAKSCQEDFRGI